jgi:hypothetical protein
MSDTKKDGGPAFPSQALGTDGLPVSELSGGMTLRDYFAGQALIAVIERGSGCNFSYEDYGKEAYKFADGMIKARES